MSPDPNFGQPFRNQIREGLPVIRPESAAIAGPLQLPKTRLARYDKLIFKIGAIGKKT